MTATFYRWLIDQLWLVICDQMGYLPGKTPDIRPPYVWHWAELNAWDCHRHRPWLQDRRTTERWDAFRANYDNIILRQIMDQSICSWLLEQTWIILRDNLGHGPFHSSAVRLPSVWWWAEQSAIDSHFNRPWANNRWAVVDWSGFCQWRASRQNDDEW